MRKGFLGTIAALAAGAGAAWGQPPVEPAGPLPRAPGTLPGLVGPGLDMPVAPQPPIGGPPVFGGMPSRAIPGNAGFTPPAAIMPPGNFGPPNDPLGIGPVGEFGPPPGPMYPMPGPYAEQSFQPSPITPPPNSGVNGLGGVNYSAAPHWWFDGEYLLWFTSGQRVPTPLLTTSAPSDSGILGASTTTVLAGGGRALGYHAINGFRLAAGFFGDADRRFGFEMSGFLLERSSNIQNFGSIGDASGIPTLARPFIDLNGAQSTLVLSNPNFGPARVQIGTNTQTWGVEPVGVWNIFRSTPTKRGFWSLDFLAGYDYIQIKENLWIQSRTQLRDMVALPTFIAGQNGIAIAPVETGFGGVIVGGPAVVQVRDQFTSTNMFNGLLLGLRGEGRYGMFTASWYGKVGIGEMHERVQIFGGSSFVDPTGNSGSTFLNQRIFESGVNGGVGAAVGGVLANPSNIGTFVHDRFTLIPQAGINLGIALTTGLTGYIGVSGMYFPSVVRPGLQINPVVSSATIPFGANYGASGAQRSPFYNIRETNQVIGGVNFGLKLRY